MAKVRWHKVLSRKCDVQKSMQFVYGMAGDAWRTLRLQPVSNQFYYFDGLTTHGYSDLKQYDRYITSIKRKYADINFVKNYPERILRVCKGALQRAQVLNKKIDKSLNNEQTLSVLYKYEKIWRDFYPWAWTFFYSANLEDVVFNELKKIIGNEQTLETMPIITAPEKVTPIISAEIATLKLAQIELQSAPAQRLARKMAAQYGWMSVYNFNDNPRTTEYYLREAKELQKSNINLKEKLTGISNQRKTGQKYYRLFIRGIKDPLLKNQIGLLHQMGYLRDFRESVRDKLTLMEKPLYQAISRQLGFSMEETTALMTAEIAQALFSEKIRRSCREKAKKRLSGFVYIFKNGREKVVENEFEIREYAKSQVNEDLTKELTGKVAYNGGIVRGRAKIVYSGGEVGKVLPGDVLITPATKPDFVPAMKNAVAIVTDEGGLTSHAAIVARELKKPCIIGTKLSTRMFKDGDLIQVDSNTGVVKKL